MINRTKKLRFIQIILLIFGISIVYFTYNQKEAEKEKPIISKSIKDKMLKENNEFNNKDLFVDVEYAGIDLNGNRYLIKAQEAY